MTIIVTVCLPHTKGMVGKFTGTSVLWMENKIQNAYETYKGVLGYYA